MLHTRTCTLLTANMYLRVPAPKQRFGDSELKKERRRAISVDVSAVAATQHSQWMRTEVDCAAQAGEAAQDHAYCRQEGWTAMSHGRLEPAA